MTSPLNTVPNYHAVLVRFVGPSNERGSRVKLTSQRFERDSVTLSKDDSFRDAADQAAQWLVDHGYRIAGQAELPKGQTMLFTDNEGQGFLRLKNAKLGDKRA